MQDFAPDKRKYLVTSAQLSQIFPPDFENPTTFADADDNDSSDTDDVAVISDDRR